MAASAILRTTREVQNDVMLQQLPLPAELVGTAGVVTVRDARDSDVDAILALLADDPLSVARGDVAAPDDRTVSLAALREISENPANALLVVQDATGIIGTMQLTRIPGMARRGATRLLIEAVRVSSERRSSGIGGLMMRWVIEVAAPATGCTLIQLTSDGSRTRAHRFYERLGFVGSHVGFKYRLS